MIPYILFSSRNRPCLTSEHIVGVKAAMQLAGHLLHEHAGVVVLEVAQHGLELVPLDQLLRLLVPLVDEREDREQP